jgi:tRNA (adenine22-N1)-methyltransferase
MAGMVALSARMQAVADMVTQGNRVCDVGCDHGYVSIYLIQKGISPEVLAMDINEGPLLRAKAHVEKAGLSNYITLRMSDGLSAYEKGQAKTLICAGMGGRLMQRILNREPEKTRDFEELILQPQSEIASFRESLRKMDYSIVRENMILEEDKFYPVIKAVPVRASHKGENPTDDLLWQEVEDCFGPILLKEKHPVLLKYLEREWENSCELKERLLGAAGSKRAGQRMEELAVKMQYLQRAAEFCGLRLK